MHKSREMFSTLGYTWVGKTEPQDLVLTDVLLPPCDDGDVLVENQAIGLNPVDWKLCTRNVFQQDHVPGVDGMGVVIHAGANSHIRVGTRVAYHTNLKNSGSFARHTVVAARAVFPVPDQVSDVVAAAIPCPALTAWQALHKVPDVKGRDVLVCGAGGSVGSFLAQLLIQAGARVYCTASPSHHERLFRFGAVGCVDYHQPGWRDEQFPRKFFAAFDCVSQANAASLAPLLLFGGHLVCVVGRVDAPLVPAFTTVISYHEIALGATHQFGTDEQWSELMRAGTKILDDIAVGRLAVGQVNVGSFDQLREKLAELKKRADGVKFVIRIDKNELKMLKN